MLVDKDGNVLDDKKEAVVTKLFLEKKLSTTKKITTSDEGQKRTEKFTTNEEVVKDTDEVHKCTKNVTTNKDVEKGT